MKRFSIYFLAIAFLSTLAITLAGCSDPKPNVIPPAPPAAVETQTPDVPAEEAELLLPPDSKGEGSEPKNSGPFGGATLPDQPSEEASEE